MKKIISAIILFLASTSCYSQTENTDKKFEFGFNLGVNRANLIVKEAPSLIPSFVANEFGFDLGVLMNYKISKIISFSPQTELGFNNSSVNNYWTGTEEIMPISLGVKAHFQIKLSQAKISPYLIIGPSARLDIKNENDYPKPARNLAVDFGFGVENKLSHFKIAPELIYSLGLFNVNSLVEETYYHKLSLVLNFKD